MAGCLKSAHLGLFGDFGKMEMVTTIKKSLEPFARLDAILAFELKTEKSEWRMPFESLGVTARFNFAEKERLAHLSFSVARMGQLMSGIICILGHKGFVAQMQGLVGRRNFAQPDVLGRIEWLALCPQYDLVMRGGGKLDPRSRSFLSWRPQQLPSVAPRIIRPVGGTVDVRMYSNECFKDRGLAVVACFRHCRDDFPVSPTGAADATLFEC